MGKILKMKRRLRLRLGRPEKIVYLYVGPCLAVYAGFLLGRLLPAYITWYVMLGVLAAAIALSCAYQVGVYVWAELRRVL